MAESAPSQVLFFSMKGELPGDGVFLRGDAAIYVSGGKEEQIFSLGDLHVPGEHNRENALAAALAAIVSGVPVGKIAAGIRTFKGVPHRLEFVAGKRGVTYWNDTAATIPEAAISALHAFDGKDIILLVGGSDKNLKFTELAKEIYARTKSIVFFHGAATENLKRELCKVIPEGEHDCRFEEVTSMAKAVEFASRGAAPGDVVLLSPGAASFGLFKNEFDRGNQFREAVSALPEK
jgi:UDP-N-acetylmuramoylalanine--D-glutamate ligase